MMHNALTHKAPFVIGVAGGTGSGKTTVSTYIQEAVGPEHIAYINTTIIITTTVTCRTRSGPSSTTITPTAWTPR